MKDTESAGMGNIYISSEQIIQEVQKYRCIYDPDDPDHKDRDVLRDAWLSVTQAVVGEAWANLNSAEKNEAAEDTEKRWRNLRDIIRKSLNISGSAPRPATVTDEMPLLSEEDHTNSLSETDDTAAAQGADEETETSSSQAVGISQPEENSGVIDYLDDTTLEADATPEADAAPEAGATPEADELNKTSYSRPATRSPAPKRKKNKPRQIIYNLKKDNSFERDQSSASVPHITCTPDLTSFSGVNYPVRQKTCMPERENPDRMFLLSLLPRVSALSSRNKLDFQIKAMQMLGRFENYDTNS